MFSVIACALLSAPGTAVATSVRAPTDALKQHYITTYSAVAAKLRGHFDVDPEKTLLNNATGRYEWELGDSWVSGFYPGLLWQLYNTTGDESFRGAAVEWTAGREIKKTYTGSHDIGFMIFCSFGQGLLLDGRNTTYRDVILTAAHSLATRYNSKVGMTRSWGKTSDQDSFQVIIDNLMNLELLFWSGKASGNQTLTDMATSHARRTGELWIRNDGSTAHLCVFDPKSGALKTPCTGTPQGLSANSTWARGQAWGVYGFTLAYRYTKDPIFLKYARDVSEYYLRNANPSDLIPAWDFDARAPENYNDTSAAAITASGLIELAGYTKEERYLAAAEKIVSSFANVAGLQGDPAKTDAVLVANHHDCGSDECTVIETDYYALEAIRRLEAGRLRFL